MLRRNAPNLIYALRERVVEADHGVQLDGERLEVRLGLWTLTDLGPWRRRHEGGRDGQAGKSDGELLRRGLTVSVVATGARRRWVRRS